MQKIISIIIGLCICYSSALGQLQRWGGIKDNANWGIRVHHSNGSHSDYRGNGTAVSISQTSFIEVMGPFELDRNKSSIVLTTSGNASPGQYTVRKNANKYHAIAYSETNFSGLVTYLRLNELYSNLYGSGPGQGIKSLRTQAKANYRDINSGSSSGSWTTYKCIGDHPTVNPAAKDIEVRHGKCAGGIVN